MKRIIGLALCLVPILCAHPAMAATVVPPEVQQPGTQPNGVGNLESPDKCDNCHGGYNQAVEPAFNWRGSMMGNAGRDPLFWATLAVAEQDFDGAGDLCIRCHSTGGWYAGRSTPTDGSGLSATGDADGVDCDTCHKMTNPNNSEHLGAMFPPYLAIDPFPPYEGYYGSGMLSLWGGNQKLGPYSNADAKHQFLQSKFHRSVDFCGSCHDVSNPVVGDLAPNHGVPNGTAGSVTFSGNLADDNVDTKAAFNNPPYKYGVVERTFSEFKSGLLSRTLVSNYASLPTDLKAGAVMMAYNAALGAGTGGNYADGTPRYFGCQSCHVRPTTGQGCNKAGVQTRTDLPLHDMTGGNVWAPDAILYMNTKGTLRLGGGLTATQINAIKAGKTRALLQLQKAASLAVTSNTLRITNLTGHKLISGYPEGRRMWLNVKWYDGANNLLREDGKYGVVGNIAFNGTQYPVKSILDLTGANTKIYEAHYAMTQEWANSLLSLGYSSSLALSYDRSTGAANYSLGQLAAQTLGSDHETFHFVLNNSVAKDNRIPPYGMSYDEAKKRNALPAPAAQYGTPATGGTYNYWDEVTLTPPPGAAYAKIDLLYQTTSWEYIQFLWKANSRTNAFLAAEGDNLLDAWLNTGMAEPVVVASTTWGSAPTPTCATPGAPTSLTATAGRRSVILSWTAPAPAPTGGYRIYYDQAGKLVYRASTTSTTYTDSGLTRGTTYTYFVTSWNDCNGNGLFDTGTDTESAASNKASATAQ